MRKLFRTDQGIVFNLKNNTRLRLDNPVTMATTVKRNSSCFFCKIESKDLMKEGKSLNACGRCKLALYCSVSCQKSDYSGHKIMCLEFIRKPNTEADKIKKFLEENYQVKSFQGSDVVMRSMQMMMFNNEFQIKLSRYLWDIFCFILN